MFLQVYPQTYKSDTAVLEYYIWNQKISLSSSLGHSSSELWGKLQGLSNSYFFIQNIGIRTNTEGHCEEQMR